MSWRRFLVLLSGLSAESRWVRALAEQHRKDAKRVKFRTQGEAVAYAASGYGMA